MGTKTQACPARSHAKIGKSRGGSREGKTEREEESQVDLSCIAERANSLGGVSASHKKLK